MSATATANDKIQDRLLDSTGLSIDRLPMLHVIFDRMANVWLEGIRHLATSPAYCSLTMIEIGRISDILEMYESNAIAAVYQAPEWDSQVLVGLDRDFVFSMIEVLLGSDGAEPPIDEERGFSNIERRVSDLIFRHLSKAMRTAFKQVTNVHFRHERTETRMDFAVIGRRTSRAVVAKFLVQTLNRGGEIFVIIPQSALTPMRQNLMRVISNEPTVRDPRWSKQIKSEVQRAEVTLTAVLEKRYLTLEEIASLEVGQTIRLQASPKSLVTLESDDQPLFKCFLGKSDGAYSLRLEEAIDNKKDIIEDLLSK
ncbi:flagellar motor switch protein FliM [Pseudochelatococcus contaminans]|uniref:Flagellar motor switch protein FliM n=1 Tax=Pseudochelatococcus contaminans TaxID=1538103 RepID=A0A7W5Z114_9HYPH|nr:FliM/FliN family flagellar motor switch protein [Pseudochelatococcus contaminans]MBB3808018.1 flagellar motor switch protein FliM [Pseudochelatococcus contaminans]